ncbi:transglutaminase domain-containing protein [Luteimonas sp. R10]|nr:transglutaminase domain-containing protein [Luteimonas sp. R10]
MIDAGRFRDAEARIAGMLETAEDDEALRDALEFQRERMRRIRLDFSLDEAAAKAAVRKQAPDVGDAEFAAWDRAGLIERIEIDGEKRYFNRAVFNLFRLVPEAAARRAPPVRPFSQGPYEALHPHHEEVLAAGKDGDATSVAPRRVRITQSLTVDADAVPAGETVRAWIPYPRAIPGQQEDIRLVDSEPGGARIAPESAPQRTAYLERPAVAGEPTRFSVSYELTIHARHFDIDPERVVAADIDASLAPYVAERPPHVVFTDAMRAYSRKVVGDETNPYRIAQKLFAAVDEIPWGGAREYSTLSNIGDHALHADHADCGQVTLLLVTLLRMNGIPARWQSGWTFSDNDVGYDNMHDWGWLYLAPYGWVPMDVTTGLLDSDDPALRWFYLGGLDAYRIAFNDDWSQPFVPPKRHFRSETVDSQRGEAEWDGGNLYFDQWDYDFEWQILPPKQEREH